MRSIRLRVFRGTPESDPSFDEFDVPAGGGGGVLGGGGWWLMRSIRLRVFRGTPESDPSFDEFDVPAEEGMVVLDALHWVQAHAAPDLAVRWNCKAAKCGSCGAEGNGMPRPPP